MQNKMIFKLDGKNFKEGMDKINHCGLIDVVVNKENIGNIIVSKHNESILKIELLIIKQQLRANGFGTKTIENFKEYAKSFGFKKITGTCSTELINFYKKVGASFISVTEEPCTEINNKFYINL